MVNNLLVNPKARAKYDMDDFRKEAVLRVRRFMNDILLDQLPVLKDLQRVLDELTMGVSSRPDDSQTGHLIIEQVGLLCRCPQAHDGCLHAWKLFCTSLLTAQWQMYECLEEVLHFAVDCSGKCMHAWKRFCTLLLTA